MTQADHKLGESELVQLHDTLLDGSKVEMMFDSMKDFYSFRTMLYRYKNYHEDLLLGIYGENDEQAKKKSIVIEAGEPSPDGFIFTFKFGKPMPKKTYKFRILEDDDVKEE